MFRTQQNIHLEYLLYISVFIVILLAMNLPPADVFKITDTPLGTLSPIRLAIPVLFLLIIAISLILKREILIFKADILSLLAFMILICLNFNKLSFVIYYFIFFVLSFLIGRMVSNFIPHKKILGFLMIAGVLQAFLTLILYFKAPDFISITTSDRDLFRNFNNRLENGFNLRASGTIGHPVVLGTILLPTFVITIQDFFSKEKNKFKKLINILFILILSFAIYLTFSRSTWLICVFIFLFTLIKKRKFNKSKSFFVLLISIMVILFTKIGESFFQRLSLLFSSNEGSVSHRLYMYKWTLDQITTNVKTLMVGFGAGSLETVLEENPPIDNFLVIDNTFLSILIETGFIGLFLFLFILLISIKFYYNNLKLNFEHNSYVFLLIIISFCLSGIIFDLFYWEQTGFLLTFLIGYSSRERFEGEKIFKK